MPLTSEKPSVEMTEGQQTALIHLGKFLSSNDLATLLAGPAGSGKTWLIQRAIQGMFDRERLVICAPTHKACNVLRQGLHNGYNITTVASLLSMRPYVNLEKGIETYTQQGPDKVKQGMRILVDETSMLTEEILDLLIKAAARERAKLVFVGDAYQLPPVKEGHDDPLATPPAFLRDYDGGKVELTEIVRQALDNPLIMIAHQYRAFLMGENVDPAAVDVPLYSGKGNPPHGVYRLLPDVMKKELHQAYLMADTLGDPYYARTIAYTNKAVRAKLDFIRHEVLGVPRAEPWRVGDPAVVNASVTRRVAGEDAILLTTDALVAVKGVVPDELHGLKGWRITVDPCGIPDERPTNDTDARVDEDTWWPEGGYDDNREKLPIKVFVPRDWSVAERCLDTLRREANQFKKGSPEFKRAWGRFYGVKREFVDLRQPYASTVHKTQGSTFTDTFIMVDDIVEKSRSKAMTARLLYVALTRATARAYINAPLPVIKHLEVVEGGWT